ncbi:sulfite exporter TauE/SafE family protein [Candidatus Nomurabacteria bacterium]|nr:sulfite exporter TauE/SafE family protein [Candidatus Nomurabacteria bacterium]
MSKKHVNKKHKSTPKTCELFVEGMHCPSCELLIEKRLLEMKTVEYADASLNKSCVTLRYTDGVKPSLSKINKIFEDVGYRFADKKFKHEEDSPAIRIKNGALEVNPDKLKKTISIFLVSISFLVLFAVVEKLQLGRYVSVDSSSSLFAFAALGLVAGTSSCAALVGGILLSMVKGWNEQYIGESDIHKAKPHFMFHLGRIFSYTLLGGVLGLLGDAVSLNNVTIYAILTISVSLIMLILAMQMLGVSWAQKFRISLPKSFSRLADKNNSAHRLPFVIGASTFFLPCGFTLIAQGVALTTGSFWQGALVMLVFALGTLPTLLFISFTGVRFNRKPHLTAKFNQIAGLIIIFFALYNINAQLNLLGIKSLSDLNLGGERTSVTKETVVLDSDGQQRIQITAEGFSYIPTSGTVLKAGVPAVIEVDNKGIQGCGSFMAARGLFDGWFELKPGINEISFTPRAGTYKLTCTMGMVRPVTIIVE